MRTVCSILLLTLLFAAGSLSGQRLTDKRARITYVSLPEKKLPDEFTTYSVSIFGSTMVGAGYHADSAGKLISMDGFKRVGYSSTDGGGHLRIFVNTGTVYMGRSELKSKKNTVKDKKTGKETVTWEYWYEIPFQAAPTFNIYDPDGNILASGGGNRSENKRTRVYSNPTDLNKNSGRLITELRKDFSKNATDGVIAEVNTTLSRNFDFNKTSDNPEFYLIVNHDTEDNFKKYFEQLDTEWKSLDAATPVNELRSRFGDALAFYEKTAEIDPKGDKKLSRVFEAANYNVALLSFYLDDFEKAVKYANRVIAQEDGKHKKSGDLIERVQKVKQLMDLHGVNTLHFARDLTNAMAPSALKALEKEQAELESKNNLLEGTITVNGETVPGTFLSEKESGELDFSQKGNTKFKAQIDDKEMEYDLTAKEVSAFSIGDRNFVKMTFSPSAKGKSEAGTHILEEIYSSDKINLYKYYPSSGALSDAKTEFAFRKAAEDTPVSLYDTRFLILKKGLADYFADCADLKAMCEGEGFELEQESLLKAARIYAEVCK